jgi:D-psicose/D-tagatose/L-ribulose 3-epimerase
LRISISNIAWDVKEDSAVADLLQSLNVDTIDLAPGKYIKNFQAVDLNVCQAVKSWWLERGIRFAGMQSLLFGTEGLNLFGPTEVQDRMLLHFSSVCLIGEALDARRLVFGSPKNRDRTGLDDRTAFAMACEFFLKLATIAESYGVTICLEPNPSYYGANFMTTTPETAAVVTEVNHPYLKLQLDTGSMCMNQENPELICSTYQAIIGHVHASEPKLKPVGFGECDHRANSAAIASHLPEAIVTIEMLTASEAAPLETIAASVRFTKDHYLGVEKEAHP